MKDNVFPNLLSSNQNPTQNSLPFTIHAAQLSGDNDLFPTHTHGLADIGMPEFIMDPLAFGPENNGALINDVYCYFKRNKKGLGIVLSGKTVRLPINKVIPKWKNGPKYKLCFREVTTEFQAVKEAYPAGVDQETRFVQIYVDGDDFALTDEYYKTYFRDCNSDSIDDILKKAGDNYEDITMFNFNENWNLVEPHLTDPEVLEALNRCMTQFVDNHYDGDLPPWDPKNKIGPWQYMAFEYWDDKALSKMNGGPKMLAIRKKYDKIAENKGLNFQDCWSSQRSPELEQLFTAYGRELMALMDSFKPKPNTYQWYQCHLAGNYLLDWQKILAIKVFPEHNWRTWIIKHGEPNIVMDSTVLGVHPSGKAMIFDIFKFEDYSVEGIVKDADRLELRVPVN